jgi:hypothetical protein
LPVELGHCLKNRQTPADGAFRIVIMGRRPAEVGHHAVAKVLSHITAEAVYRLGRRTVVGGYRLAPILGVESSGDRSRVDQVTEQDGQMAPLSA